MAKNNQDPNEEENQELEFEKTINLEGDSDSDFDLVFKDIQENELEEPEQDGDYASGVGGQTIALGDDDDLIEELLQADESQTESGQLRTAQLDTDPNVSGSGEHLETEKLGTSGGSSQIGSHTVDSGSMGSSKLKEIWGRFGSDADPMMSYEQSGSLRKTIGVEYKLNPRYVKSGAWKIDPGTEIDYRLGRVVGEGGMGEVFSAKQQAVDRKVAFKRIRKSLMDETNNNPEKRKRIERKFLTEAHITASLDHPNIVTIHDLGIDQDGNVFYCMEFISGSEWQQVFNEQSLEENLEILLSVADGVAYAHSKDIIHRDLKPENVMLGKFRQVSIMDWGLAVDLKQGRPTNLAGTPAYLAPEMAKGPKSSINKSSDIYLLGALLFHICTKRPPHYGKTMSACIQSAAQNTFQKKTSAPEALKPLLDIAFKAMKTEQEERYATVSDFQDAIRTYQSTQQSIEQSFALSEESEQDLREAQEEVNYEKFSSALFGFREAQRLFPENSNAVVGLSQTKHAYASCALQREDFELGLSLLDENESDDQPLIQQLRKSQKTVESRKSRVKLLAIASALLLSGFLVYFAYNNIEQRRLTKKAQDSTKVAQDSLTEQKRLTKVAKDSEVEANRQTKLAKASETEAKRQTKLAKDAETEARRQAKLAKDAETEAKRQAKLARDAETEANRQTKLANDAKDDAKEEAKLKEQQRLRAKEAETLARGNAKMAEKQKNLAKSRLFNSNINLADSLIRDNQIPQALDALNFAKSAEYNRLLHLCHTEDVAEARFRNAVGFTPISKNKMVVADRNGLVSVWDQNSNKTTKLKTGVQISSFDVSKNGNLIVIGSSVEAKKLTVWNLDTGRMVRDLSDSIKGNYVTCVEFSPNGRQLAVADSNSGVFGWQVSGSSLGSPLKFPRLHPDDPVNDTSFSPDGSRLATVSKSGLCLVWNWQSRTPFTAYAHDSPLKAVAFRPSKSGTSKELACADATGAIVFLDATIANDYRQWMKQENPQRLSALKTKIRKSTLEAHQSAVNAIRFSKNGSILYSGGDDRVVRIWNLKKQVEIKSLRGHEESVTALRVLNGGSTIASIAQTGQLRVWDVNKYEDQRVFNSKDKTSNEFVRFSQNGRWFATGKENGKLFVRDKDSRKLAIELAFEDNLGKDASWLPRSRRLITSGKNRLTIWDDGRSVFETKKIGGDGRFAVSSDERLMVTGGDAGQRGKRAQPTSVWNVQTGQKIADLLPSGSRYKTTAIAISPNSRYAAVATGSTEGIVFLFDLLTMQKVDQVEAHRGWISDLKFFPDNRLASADSLEGYVNVWTTTGGRLNHQKKVDDIVGSYIRISVAPDGSRFVTSSSEKYLTILKVWDGRSFAPISTKKFKSSIRFAEFRKDSKIGYVQADGRFGTWDLNGQSNAKPKPFRQVSLKGRLVNGWNQVDEDTTVTYGNGFTYLTSSTQSGVLDSYGNVSRCIDAQFVNKDTVIAALYADGLVRFWDLKTRTILGVLSSESKNAPFTGMDVSPDHKSIVVCNEAGIKLVDAETRKVIKERSIEQTITCVDWPEMETIFLGTSSGKVLEAGLGNPKLKQVSACDSRIDSIDVTPEGDAIGLIAKSASEETGLIYVLRKELSESDTAESDAHESEAAVGEDAAENEKAENLEWVLVKPNGEKAATIDLFDSGKRAVSGNQSGTVTVWEIPTSSEESLRQLISMSHGDNAVSGISISPDNRLLLTSSSDGKSVLWLTEGWNDDVQ